MQPLSGGPRSTLLQLPANKEKQQQLLLFSGPA
jgi:hypothetical protein